MRLMSRDVMAVGYLIIIINQEGETIKATFDLLMDLEKHFVHMA